MGIFLATPVVDGAALLLLRWRSRAFESWKARKCQHVVEKGVVLSTQGMDIPVTYNEDGTYSADAMGMEIPGTWRIDGTSLCTESSMQPGENCTEYPEGKGPGDSFEVEGAMGTATITINE